MSKRLEFNVGQQKVWDEILEYNNLFVAGVAGVGKSFIINRLRELYGHETLFTSTTGRSAADIGGSTLHSALCLPTVHPTRGSLSKISDRVAKLFAKGTVRRIVIDEVGMLTAGSMYALSQRIKHFEKAVGRFTKDYKIQVIMFGDLGQLGAVMGDKEKELAKKSYKTTKFFKMRQFEQMDFKFVELTKNERQSEEELRKMLGHIRRGKSKRIKLPNGGYFTSLDKDVKDAIKYFNKHCYHGGKVPTDKVTLTPTNRKVAEYNKVVFDKNPNPIRVYSAERYGDFKVKDIPTDMELSLKDGLKVIILRNDRDGEYVNGSTGVVTHMADEGVWVRLDDTINEVLISQAEWETVDYVMKDDEDGEEELDTEVSGTFKQIPLKPCTALTINRSQGQTLNESVVDLGQGLPFAPALLYVALSRVKELKGIYLTREIKESDILVDHEALEWLEEKLAIQLEEDKKDITVNGLQHDSSSIDEWSDDLPMI